MSGTPKEQITDPAKQAAFDALQTLSDEDHFVLLVTLVLKFPETSLLLIKDLKEQVYGRS
jgi:hypothetical protein